jgi:hypothetical protein
MVVAQVDLHCVFWFIAVVLLPNVSDGKLCIALTVLGGISMMLD